MLRVCFSYLNARGMQETVALTTVVRGGIKTKTPVESEIKRRENNARHYALRACCAQSTCMQSVVVYCGSTVP